MEKYQPSPEEISKAEEMMSDNQKYASQDRERLIANFDNHDEYKKIRNKYDEIKKDNGLKTDEEVRGMLVRIEEATSQAEKQKLQNIVQDIVNKDCVTELMKVREKAIPLSYDFLEHLSDGYGLGRYEGAKGAVNKISLKGIDRRDMEVIFSSFLLKYPSLYDELSGDSLDRWGLSSDVRSLLEKNSGLIKNTYDVKFTSNLDSTMGGLGNTGEEFSEKENSTIITPWIGERKIKVIGKLDEVEIDCSERPSNSLALLAEYAEEAGGKVQYLIEDDYGVEHVYESPSDVKNMEKTDENKLVYQTGNGEKSKIEDVLDEKTVKSLKNVSKG